MIAISAKEFKEKRKRKHKNKKCKGCQYSCWQWDDVAILKCKRDLRKK